MTQPIPKKIKDNKPEIAKKTYNTLLVDGSNILRLSLSKDKRTSSNDTEVGGIFQFLLQIKIMLQKGNFRYVYVFWDGDRGGQLRFNELPEYKANRDKNYEEADLSPYMKMVNERVRSMQRYLFNKEKAEEKKKEKELFFEQRNVIMQCLEELFVRQCVVDEIEADDLIAYYVLNKESNEKIVIMSNDRDYTQLISDDVIVYLQDSKTFVNSRNSVQELGFTYKNVLLMKMLCGDVSDNIKGIKGVGEKTLFKYIPELIKDELTIKDVIKKAKDLNENRLNNGKKPLVWATNVVERNTDSSAGKEIYEINKKIIDLKHPLLSDEAKELMDNMIHAPLDPEGRSMTNLYKILNENGIDDLKDESRFSNFFVEYQYLIDREKKNQ